MKKISIFIIIFLLASCSNNQNNKSKETVNINDSTDSINISDSQNIGESICMNNYGENVNNKLGLNEKGEYICDCNIGYAWNSDGNGCIINNEYKLLSKDNLNITNNISNFELSTPPRLINKTFTSVILEWDKVNMASGYIVLYSKTSVATSTDPNALYDNETNQVAGTGTIISDLEANTKYYFTVIPIDKEGNQGSIFSSELSVITDSINLSNSTNNGETLCKNNYGENVNNKLGLNEKGEYICDCDIGYAWNSDGNGCVDKLDKIVPIVISNNSTINSDLIKTNYVQPEIYPVINTNDTINVKGYYKNNGTYVDSYKRTKPNNTKLDNLGCIYGGRCN